MSHCTSYSEQQASCNQGLVNYDTDRLSGCCPESAWTVHDILPRACSCTPESLIQVLARGLKWHRQKSTCSRARVAGSGDILFAAWLLIKPLRAAFQNVDLLARSVHIWLASKPTSANSGRLPRKDKVLFVIPGAEGCMLDTTDEELTLKRFVYRTQTLQVPAVGDIQSTMVSNLAAQG